MEYSKIIAVTGLPGLYELINSKTDGAIVRSLDDKSTRFVSSRIHQFSHLESIEVYTIKENVNLVDILKAMESSTEKLPEEKNDADIKKYFQKVYADLDFERVYNSDLKKMVKWFSALKKHNIEIKLTEVVEEPVVEDVVEKKKEKPVPAASEEKPKAAKKTKAEEPVAEEKSKAKKEEKKKPVEKKKKEEKKEKPAAKDKAKKAPAKKKNK
jgi:outer membrane biosynthesis protein TonB